MSQVSFNFHGQSQHAACASSSISSMSFEKSLPKSVDTVIVGNGPAALILSYILHGNCPFYDTSFNNHPDRILDTKLRADLIYDGFDVGDITAHFPSSRFSYSTAALPINVLLDTLLRPLADTDPGAYKPCVSWKRLPDRAVSHVLLSCTKPGGQWASNPVRASWDIGALSYLDQLSLPGYSLRDHLASRYSPEESDFVRPTRAEIADYLAAYPAAVGIEDSVFPPALVSNVKRTQQGFYIGSHSISCKHLVLASGIFSNLLPARPQLYPLLELPESQASEPPLLVVGSGFSAADIIITNLPRRKIIHIFKWDPDNRPSPLRACHKSAYPEYARVYRQMKLAAIALLGEGEGSLALTRRKSNTLKHTKADPNYEGFPNTYIAEATARNGAGTVELRLPSGKMTKRAVSELAYVIGRRGSLAYLDSELQKEVVGPEPPKEKSEKISGRTLRAKVQEDLEVAPNVFVIGSLTGDSLIRHAYGSCIYAAHKILLESGRATRNDIVPEPVISGLSPALNKSNTVDGSGYEVGNSPSPPLAERSAVPRNHIEMETAEPIKRTKRSRWKSDSLRRLMAPLKKCKSR